MNTYIFAILDTVANALIGGLLLHKHEAAAVRFYSDVATMKDSQIARHPQDFNLLQLGYLDDEHQLVPDYRVVLTGENWLAANASTEHLPSLEKR